MQNTLLKTARHTALFLILAVGSASAFAQSSEQWRAMNRPVEPFHIMDNLYYVGANSVAAYLITTPAGHILIDGGFEETVPMIRSGIETMGFELKDVKILLSSHAHFDHCAGLAQLKKESGARFFAMEQDADILERGGLGDDLFGDEMTFPAIEVDRRLKDGDTVKLGGTTLTAHRTGGHTRGCTSWELELKDRDSQGPGPGEGEGEGEATSHRAVSICSLSALEGMQFFDHPTYPGIKEDFERSFEVLEAIAADVFLASHADFAQLVEKNQRKKKGEPSPFIDPEGYHRYIERARKNFETMVAAEAQQLSKGRNEGPGTAEEGTPHD